MPLKKLPVKPLTNIVTTTPKSLLPKRTPSCPINTQNPLPLPTQSIQTDPPFPTLSLSLTSQESLNQFLQSHLSPPLTPQSLLSFLKKKLHYHPKFTHFDFHVFNWATSIDGFCHDHSTYSWMARTLAASHRLDDVLSLLQSIVSNPCPCSDDTIFSCPATEPTFRFAIYSLCRAGRLHDALLAFQAVKRAIDGKPDRALYNILIHGFVRARDHAKAIELYRKMIEDGVRPDVCTFNILIESFCRHSSFDSALGLFKEMRAKGCTPNVVSFNTLIRGCFRNGMIERAIGIAYEMLELECRFSAATCEILVDGLCREGLVIRAGEILMDLLRKGAVPDGFDCLRLVEALCREGKVERAAVVVDELQIKGKPLDTVVCTTLIECMRKSGKVGEAFKLMEKMLKNGVVPDSVTFNCLLQSLCDVGRTTDANRLRVLASGKGLVVDYVTYDTLVSGFSREVKKAQDCEVIPGRGSFPLDFPNCILRYV
ncbi:hypothetical protein MRB53_023797 [Persea americana]|uniref:Uncharacterized protein n=1 Tax=Persea americana TaxID=3435 RepID=A0ACC2LAG4_PERAE|nr:hypothetical protein MRB53_023797 [Persea americana]